MTVDKKPLPHDLIDQLLANYKKPEDLIGEDGLLKQLTKAGGRSYGTRSNRQPHKMRCGKIAALLTAEPLHRLDGSLTSLTRK
jgi:hypothetical protein